MAPDWWLSSWRTVVDDFPSDPNSGQYRTTGASRSSSPRSSSTCAHIVVRPFVADITTARVSCAQVRPGPAGPVHRSTTHSPST